MKMQELPTLYCVNYKKEEKRCLILLIFLPLQVSVSTWQRARC